MVACETIADVVMVTWEFDEGTYCALSTRVDESEGRACYYELSEARSLAGVAFAQVVPGPAAVTVKVYAPEAEKPPSVYFDTRQEVPFAVLRHFVDLVTAELEPDA
jgi:hypothetical protein